MKKILVALIITLCSTSLFAKEGYNIKVHIVGLKDSMCFLANHFGDKQYLQDSCKADAKGNLLFEGKESLRAGMYLVVMPNKRYFEIMVDKQQFFSVEADTSLNPSKVSFKNSQDNIDFYAWLNYVSSKRSEVETLRAKLMAMPEAERANSADQKKLDKIDKEIEMYQIDYITKNPNAFLSAVFKATREVDVPDAPILPNGQKDSTFQFYYYRAHYFDNINFGDARLLRTPIFHQKLDYYIHKLTVQMPDSVIVQADYLVGLAKKDTEVFKYVVWYITHEYETSNIMGMDAVFVHMVFTYYTKEQAYWLDDAALYKIQERAKQLDPILIGKKARNLVLADTSNHIQSMYNIKDPWTVLFFWDPDCGHCKKSMPKLIEFYKEWHSKGVEVYAVCNETEVDKWKTFIKENNLTWINVADPGLHDNFRYDFDVATTPQVFVLDKDKIIRAKKIDVDQLGDFIKHEVEKKNN